MNITLPDFSLVVLMGASGSGKSTFARTHFKPTEILSSDACRALVSDDENDQTVSNEAFEVLHFVAARRLMLKRLTVVDATNVQPEARKPLIKLAREYHCLPVAIVLDVPESVCRERNARRPDRDFGGHVIARQRRELKSSLRNLEREGFRHVYILKSDEQIANLRITRVPLYNDLRGEHGPFDIIGDVHGCYDELLTLLNELGYSADGLTAPDGRKAIFLGDLVDRGPKIPDVLRLVMGMVAAGTALCIPGNHDMKLVKALKGKNVQVTHGLAESLAQLSNETPEFKQAVRQFLDGLVSHYVLDEGKLVVAHAGMKAEMQGRASGAVREFALFGETTGETDEFGLPVRYNWTAEYRGAAMVVYGHTPVPEPEWLNHTMNIDTGCVFGGALTALRYPERELISIPALHTYDEPIRPFISADQQAPALTAQQQHDDVLDIADVTGKRFIHTRLMRNVTLREENSIAALEVMSRFAVDPRWLMYLPPTMSPCETSQLPDMLEHPAEAFAYYRSQGVPQVICEEKHMGSRAVVIICQDEGAAQQRFGIRDGAIGVCYTRTGRAFFTDARLENAFMQRLHEALTRTGVWEQFNTSWIALDCELMPWSAKAQELIQRQYAAVGAAAFTALAEVQTVLAQAAAQGLEVQALQTHYHTRLTDIQRYREAYRRYCWTVQSVADLRLAPFHLLATEGQTYFNHSHPWHIETLAAMCHADESLLFVTDYKIIDVTDTDSQAEGIQWWETLTQKGGEGMVVKPLDFMVKGQRGLVQPAIKVRGREYLRIIYGAEYTTHLAQLRQRGLGAKRSLALREFALGVEAVERFVRREPLRRVHECVFGVLALESEPVDPRL